MTGIIRFPGQRDTGHPLDPPPTHRSLRGLDKAEIWDGSTPWVVTDNELYRELISDPRVSNDIRRDGYPPMTAVFGELRRRGGFNSFDRRDGAEHEPIRKILMGDFSHKRIESLRPAIQASLDELFDTFEAGPEPGDLISTVAYPLTSSVICKLLGVPYEDYTEFGDKVSGMINVTSVDRSLAAYEEMSSYIGSLIDRSVDDPVDGLIGRLVTNQMSTGAMTRDQIISSTILILLGGYETSANSMVLGTLALLQHRQQWEELVAHADDRDLVNSTVEELLRYVSVEDQGRRRVATEDIQVGGQVIRAGDGLVFLDDMANRDPRAFPGDPDSVDIRRETRRHVGFAFGPHFCLGNRLARCELQQYYQTVARRFPNLQLAMDVSEFEFTKGQIYGLRKLPVTWSGKR